MINLQKTFEKFDSEYNLFDKIENKLSTRPDLCAFLYLEKLCPTHDEDLISGAEHDKIYLSVDCEGLEKVATEDDILYLCRCGIFYDEESLCMFV